MREFVTDVGNRIDTGVTFPVATRRWPALAGLAGVAAIVLVLVFALPRLGPGGPSPSPSSTDALPSTISTMPVREFAARVAAGELRGETVLVNARIVPNPALFLPACPPPGPCYLGDLEGTDPPLAVESRWLPTVEGEGTELNGPGIDPVWGWWDRPQAPIAGVMGLSVDSSGRVMFLGRNPREQIASTASEIPFVDLDAMPLDEIRVVPGWLADIHVPFPCPTADLVWKFAYLSGRDCGDMSWLTGDRIQFDPSRFVRPPRGLQVQSGAYLEFANAPVLHDGAGEPRAGIYVIAKRLEGRGCPSDRPPCWQWEIVGRVTINGDATQAQPLATATPEASASALPAPRSFTCAGASISVTLEDTTGLATGCSVIGVDRHNPKGATNPTGDMSTLQVLWGTTRCTTAASLDLTPLAVRYMARITEVASAAADCEDLPEAYAVQVALSAPIQADLVSVSVVRDLEPAIARTLECSIDPESPEADLAPIASVLDHIGLITSCAAFAGGPDYVATGWSDVIVRDSAPNQLQVAWATTVCDRHAQIDISRPNADWVVLEVHLTDDYAECETRAAQYLVLELAEPVLAASVSTTLRRASDVPDPNPPPSPFPQSFECSSDIFMLRDATGLVESCGAWLPDPGQSGVFESADPSSVRVAWTYSNCHGAPYAEFEEIGGRYFFRLGFIVNLPSVLPSCQPVSRTVGIDVRFMRPVDIALISAPERRPRSTIDVAPLREQAERALARWADAVSQSGGQGIVFVQGITDQSGNWEDDVGSNNKSALYAGLIEAAVPLVTEAPPPGEVQWPDGTSTTVDLLSAGDALQQLTSHATSTCDLCQPLRVTDARLVTADFETSRGAARVPVWRYSLEGSDVKVIQVAVANSISLIPPPWDPYNTPKGASIASARGAPDSRDLLVTTEEEPPANAETCTDFTAEAMESDLAVVVFIKAFHPDQSTGPDREYDDVSCGLVTLASPLGDRAVLEVTEGLPVLVLPPT